MAQTTENPSQEWPDLFIEANHPLEKEVLIRFFNANPHIKEIWFIVDMMQRNYIVFHQNYLELERLGREFNNPMTFQEIALQTDKGFTIAQDATVQFTRLLHNFLASSKMLVDVTRRWINKIFEDNEFLEIYRNKVQEMFISNVQVQFIEDLRNFTLHRALPLSIPELRMKQESETTMRSSLAIVLLKDYLLDWDNWSDLGRMQIDMAFDGNIDILSICRQYYEIVKKFTNWLFWQVRDLFNEEIEQANSIIEQLRNS